MNADSTFCEQALARPGMWISLIKCTITCAAITWGRAAITWVRAAITWVRAAISNTKQFCWIFFSVNIVVRSIQEIFAYHICYAQIIHNICILYIVWYFPR